MTLAESVYRYYLSNRQLLNDDKRFHFATRTAAWVGSPESFALLRDSRAYIAPRDTPLNVLLRTIYEIPPSDRHNAHELRAPLFARYPSLYGAHQALFRVRHLEEVFGIDARTALFSVISLNELIALRDQLLSDQQALKILSTFAINYCYLLNKVILQDSVPIPVEKFLAINSTYDTSDPLQLQLFMYFYTHCIIGETNFYVRRLPKKSQPIYSTMLRDLEPLVRKNFSSITLDNKLEFLVCARICEYETDLFERIYNECNQSVSPDGTFIIDTRNQPRRNTFTASEHRNALFIMSSSPYTPHSTRVV